MSPSKREAKDVFLKSKLDLVVSLPQSSLESPMSEKNTKILTRLYMPGPLWWALLHTHSILHLLSLLQLCWPNGQWAPIAPFTPALP